jgi:hypothetical protein
MTLVLVLLGDQGVTFLALISEQVLQPQRLPRPAEASSRGRKPSAWERGTVPFRQSSLWVKNGQLLVGEAAERRGVDAPERVVREFAKLLGQGIEPVSAGGRQDLCRRLEQTLRRSQDPSIRVIVVGEFEQGKSQLVNALVTAPVCPICDDVANVRSNGGAPRRYHFCRGRGSPRPNRTLRR